MKRSVTEVTTCKNVCQGGQRFRLRIPRRRESGGRDSGIFIRHPTLPRMQVDWPAERSWPSAKQACRCGSRAPTSRHPLRSFGGPGAAGGQAASGPARDEEPREAAASGRLRSGRWSAISPHAAWGFKIRVAEVKKRVAGTGEGVWRAS